MIISWVVYLVVAAFVIAIVGSALRVLREYERGVIFRLGSCFLSPRARA